MNNNEIELIAHRLLIAYLFGTVSNFTQVPIESIAQDLRGLGQADAVQQYINEFSRTMLLAADASAFRSKPN